MTDSKVESEDLSRDIVDTEAARRAKTILRERLEKLLADRPGKLSDLLDVEKELARVEGEIDATQSELAMMRARVATSDLKIHYEAASSPLSRGSWSPVGRAFGQVADILAVTISTMIQLFAWLLPWALVGALGFWAFRRTRVWRLSRTKLAKATEEAGDASTERV